MREGDYVGPYRLLEVLGEGGMGVVYRAEQLEPIQREVALKVLRSGTVGGQVLKRFEKERQALAVLDHPSIAKVFDAGVTDDGRSYFAMELVDGTTLAAYCDENRLSVRARVALFVRVCGAVQHAHQKGIVHRDLKPSNVLVSESDGRPLPRVIDFGIAKATETAEFDGTRLTTDDQVIGTPAYMSPEQISGSRDVDTRSDIYALGVLLYEILVGALPFERAAYRGWAAVAATLHRDPPPLAKRFDERPDSQLRVAHARSTNPAALRRTLVGDLSWIVATALEKDRDRRYETANAMALDLQRVLDFEPVLARGTAALYIVGKFVRRNRLGVAFAATLVVGLTAFSALTSVQSSRVGRARDEADARRAQAEGLIDFMLTDLREKLEPIGRLGILDDVGSQATEYFSAIPEESFSDDELASWSQALYQLGEVRLEQGDSEGAGAAFGQSLRLAGELSARAPGDADLLFGLSQSHYYVGYAAWSAGDLDAAEHEFLQYLDVARQLVGIDPESTDYRVEVGYAHSNLGSLSEARGDLAAAEDRYAMALTAERAKVEVDPSNVDFIGELAETHNKLGVVKRKRGDYSGALEQHGLELELKRQALVLQPEHAYWRFRHATAMSMVAQLATETGELERAAELLARVQPAMDSLARLDPSNMRWQRNQAWAAVLRGETLSKLGRYDEAERVFSGSERVLSRLAQVDATGFGWRQDLAGLFVARAQHDLSRQRPADSRAAAVQALELMEGRELQEVRDVGIVARAELARGHALMTMGGSDADAVEAWVSALEVMRPLAGGTDRNVLRPLRAEALLMLERSDEAWTELEALERLGFKDDRLTRLFAEHGGS